MDSVIELVKIFGGLAGILALSWNVFIYFNSRSGKLEATIGWGSNEDYSTYLYLSVINKGMDTRTIKEVALVYLDEKPLKNGTHSTRHFITELPEKSLKRGEMLIEKIQYQQNPILKELFFNRKILFRVIDTLDRKYDSLSSEYKDQNLRTNKTLSLKQEEQSKVKVAIKDKTQHYFWMFGFLLTLGFCVVMVYLLYKGKLVWVKN